jgi:hypothetical protein
MSDTVPTQLYTTRTMFTLGGSSAAVWLFSGVLALVFNVDPDKYKWIGLSVALVISFVGAMRFKRMNIQFATITFFNGLLIYVTAVGIDSINQGISRNKGKEEVSKAALIPFTDNKPWWPATTLVDSINYYKTENTKVVAIKDEYELKNKLLRDSLVIVREITPREIGPSYEIEYKKCLMENKKLLLEIAQLSKKTIQPIGKEAPQISPELKKSIVEMLPALKSLNKELLKNVNDYLNAGELDPRGQLQALRDANTNAYTLKLQIMDYNTRLDDLINKTK